MKRLIPRVSLVVAAVVASGLIVTACGSSSSSSGSAQQVIDQTFSGHKHVTSANIALSLNVTPKGSSGTPVSLTVNGPFQSNGTGQLPSFNLSLGINIRGQSISAGAVSTGSAGYLLFQGQAYTVPANTFASFKQGFLNSQSKNGQHPAGSLSSLGIDPKSWLTDLQSDGTADVGGTTTDHVSAGINLPTLLTDLATALSKAKGLNTTGAPVPSLSPAQRQQIESAIKNATVDVYSGQSDHILRRLTMNLGIQSPTNAASASTLAFDVQLTGLNQPQSISAPANPQPISNLRSALGSLSGLLGGLTGGGSGSLGGSTGSSGSGGSGSGGTGSGLGGAGSPSSATAQAYLRCVSAAGSNSAAASQCLSLLHK